MSVQLAALCPFMSPSAAAVNHMVGLNGWRGPFGRKLRDHGRGAIGLAVSCSASSPPRPRRRGVRLPALAVACALVVTASAPVASAQVNVERLRQEEVKGKAQGSVDFSARLRRGNTRSLEANLGGRFGYRGKIHRPLVVVTAGYAEGAGERFVSNAFAHLRWTAMWIERVGSELYGQAQYDQSLKLRRRLVTGAGVRVLPVIAELAELAIGTGYMLEDERLNLEATDPYPTHTLYHRWSTYVTVVAHTKDERVTFSNTAYVQPRFDAFADVKLLDDMALAVKATKWFSLVASVSFRYDSRPPKELERFDVDVETKLRFSF